MYPRCRRSDGCFPVRAACSPASRCPLPHTGFLKPAVTTYETIARVSSGGAFGRAPFDELFMLGLERDNDLPLRRATSGLATARRGALRSDTATSSRISSC